MNNRFIGASNNYQYPLEIGILRREDRSVGNGQRHGAFYFWDAKLYQDVACSKVQRMGISKCTDCPLAVSECPEWQHESRK